MRIIMTYSNIISKTYGAALALLVSLLLFGCTKEDLSDCGMVVTFSHTSTDTQEVFPEDLKQIDLFVFDDKGLFVEQHRVEGISSKETSNIRLFLAAGNYTMVAWGNLNEDYTLSTLKKGQTTLAEATLSLVRANNQVTKRLGSLYHGQITDVAIVGSGYSEKNIEMMNDANTFSITVKGLSVEADATPEKVAKQYPMYVTDNNGDYKFDNTLALKEPLTYIPTYQIVDGNIVIQTTVLRLFEKGATTLMMEKEQKARATQTLGWNLVELILKSGAIKDQQGLDRCDTYDIEIELDDQTNTTTTIKVNGWVVYDINGEL
ncbi:MAG: FimB/Mfa2 family fimbrial subunit [Mucinivorans sp.]